MIVPPSIQGRKYEKTIYWRRAAVHVDGRTKDKEPHWIFLAGSNDSTMLQLMRLGHKPLDEFGIVSEKPSASAPDGPYDLYGRWGPILCHPQGPAAFPLDQVLAYGWYHEKRVPVPGVRFPQLRGQKIAEYTCPECSNMRYLKTNHLARHMTVTHKYDRAALIALSDQMGVSFSKDLAGTIETVYEFEDEPAPEPEEPPFEVETHTAPRGGRQRERVPA